MVEIFAVLAFSIGITALFIGWIWGVVSAQKVSMRWMLAMLLLAPQPLFALTHWEHAKIPFWITLSGVALLLFTLMQASQG